MNNRRPDKLAGTDGVETEAASSSLVTIEPGNPSRPRRIKGNSKLMRLPHKQKAQIAEWLESPGVSYTETARRIRESFGISVSGVTVCKFWQKFVAPALIDQGVARFNLNATGPLLIELRIQFTSRTACIQIFQPKKQTEAQKCA